MIQALVFLHQRLGIALIITALLLALWGSLLYFRRRALSGGFRSLFLLMIGLTAAQGLSGVGTFLAGRAPARGILHIVYGIFAIVFLPGVFTYASRGDRTREAAFLTAACWVVLVAYGRGFATGQ